MKFYNLVTTKRGQFPIEDVRKGTLVLCKGEWLPAPKAELGTVKILKFHTLPTTAFAAEYVDPLGRVFPKVEPILNKFEEHDIGLSVMGFFNENRKSKGMSFGEFNISELSYWWPRITKCCNKVSLPEIGPNKKIKFLGIEFPKERMFSGNELSERNLEYYLEGMFRRNFHEHKYKLFISSRLTENSKLVLRLLGLQCKKQDESNLAICNKYQALSHVRDDYNKAKLPESFLAYVVRNRWIPGGEYDVAPMAECTPVSIEEAEGLVFPGICPDINCLSPLA